MLENVVSSTAAADNALDAAAALEAADGAAISASAAATPRIGIWNGTASRTHPNDLPTLFQSPSSKSLTYQLLPRSRSLCFQR